MIVNRRELLRTAGAAIAAQASRPRQRVAPPSSRPNPVPPTVRESWVLHLRKLAEPVLTNLASGTLRAKMPVEQAPNANRRNVTHLEAFGRLLAGIAPWLELPADASEEGRLRARLLDLARQSLARAVDPASPDVMNFTRERQPLVDAAFLGEALLRAPTALVGSLDETTKGHLVAALESTRVITPVFSNWLLFTATVEAALAALGAPFDATRVEYAVRQHEQWYKGDGAYGDGPAFHWDYYNSFVIHPMLVDVAAAFADRMAIVKELAPRIDERAKRYAAIQERLIAPDGSFPPIGRSLAYRCGAFHLLAQSALRRALPEGVPPTQVRGALTAVIARTLAASETYDRDGWLSIGFCGHQPGVGETYISTGSLYLCSVALLPLGLPAGDPFWSDPPVPFTQQRAWSGQAFPIDHALG